MTASVVGESDKGAIMMIKKPAIEEEIELQEVDDSVIGTMKINPHSYKKFWNKGIIARTKYAVAGLLFMLRREKSIRNVAKTAIVVFGLAFWVQIEFMQVMMIFLSFALLWTVETVNSAVEAVVDLVTQEYHPMAKVAKDVAASATLVATVTSATTSMVFILPPLWEKIDALLVQWFPTL
jgi:diacylglycerol kinase